MSAKFKHIDLRLIDPPFESELNTLILELDYLRKKPLGGTTHPITFFQLKEIFHLLESIGSARIEGNRTTLVEYVERKIEGSKTKEEKFLEIENNEKALDFIEENIGSCKIDRLFLSELHKIITQNLTPPPRGEGSKNSGDYRTTNVAIARSSHLPPDASAVPSYMDELFEFINRHDPPQYDLLKVALAHHRFAWIHPFDNGNGRVVRLLTYTMLIKYGFRVNVGGRIINPTAVFCSNREKYYQFLSLADKGDDNSLLKWCEYVLSGLKNEINKIDRLLDYNYLAQKILLPTLDFALDRKYITEIEYKILSVVVKKQVMQAGDLKLVLPNKLPAEISRIIRRLKEKKMLQPEKENARKYVLKFESNYLLRGIIEMLDREGFLPIPVNK
jgi:Fic family protein